MVVRGGGCVEGKRKKDPPSVSFDLPSPFADKTWQVLEAAIHEINNHNASGLSFEELYR